MVVLRGTSYLPLLHQLGNAQWTFHSGHPLRARILPRTAGYRLPCINPYLVVQRQTRPTQQDHKIQLLRILSRAYAAFISASVILNIFLGHLTKSTFQLEH